MSHLLSHLPGHLPGHDEPCVLCCQERTVRDMVEHQGLQHEDFYYLLNACPEQTGNIQNIHYHGCCL